MVCHIVHPYISNSKSKLCFYNRKMVPIKVNYCVIVCILAL